ncbi:MAG TPA: hypothetical protein VE978_01855 [Chitinophagales bacterium]|nr:hypothetical protein [Chitinophagales bacterium]
MNDKSVNKILALLVVGILFVVFAPYLFTRHLGVLNFNDTGTIGDTIGGITAPITSLIGSILVFFALKAQIDANKLIQTQIEGQKAEELVRKQIQYINEQINMVKEDINEFSFIVLEEYYDSVSQTGIVKRKQKFNYKGADAINEFMESLKQIQEAQDETASKGNPKLTELFNLLEIIKLMFDKIEKAKITDEDKQFFKSILSYQYNSKVKPAFTAKKEYPNNNGLLTKVFNLVDKINNMNQ